MLNKNGENKLKKTIKFLLVLLIIILLLLVIYKYFKIEEKILMYLYPKQYEEYVIKYSAELNIDPLLTFAIIKTESNFDEKVESKSGAIGLMQLMDKTAREQAEKINVEYTKDMLYNPEMNLKLGLNYFNMLLDYYNQNYILAFTAYNAGLGNVQKWIKEETIKQNGSDIENIPFKETNMYVRKIIRNYEMYQKLYS